MLEYHDNYKSHDPTHPSPPLTTPCKHGAHGQSVSSVITATDGQGHIQGVKMDNYRGHRRDK